MDERGCRAELLVRLLKSLHSKECQMTDEERSLLETMVAWQEARDANRLGSPEWQEVDCRYREAEAAYSIARP